MVDRLLRVHIQSPAGLWAWVTLSYNSCRVTGGDAQNPGGSTPVHVEVANSTGDAGQRKTRCQPRGAGLISSVPSITSTIDYMSLAIAMSRMNENSAGNRDKGVQPKWDFKVEPSTEFTTK